MFFDSFVIPLTVDTLSNNHCYISGRKTELGSYTSVCLLQLTLAVSGFSLVYNRSGLLEMTGDDNI